MSEFENHLEEAVKYASQQAQKSEGGDPATHVSASVDGRTNFVSKMKEEGHKKGGKYVVETNSGEVKMDPDDYQLHVNFLSGTDIQSHKKKIRGYRAFKQKMEDLGYTIGDDFVSTYSR